MAHCIFSFSTIVSRLSHICKQISSNIHTSTNLLFKELPQSVCFQYFIGLFHRSHHRHHHLYRHTSCNKSLLIYVCKVEFSTPFHSILFLSIFSFVLCLFSIRAYYIEINVHLFLIYRVKNIIKTRIGGHLACYYTKC